MASHSSATSGKRRRFAPRLEVMEDRQLLNAAVPGMTLDPLLVPKFVDQLPDPLSNDFVYKTTDTTSVTLENGKTATVPLYNVGVYQIQQDLGLGPIDPNTQKQVPTQTTVWGYGSLPTTATYPGHTFVVDGDPAGIKNQAIAVHWTNNLVDEAGKPLPHLLPVDPTLLDPNYPPSSDPNNPLGAGVPIVPHLHGGHTQAPFDGTPMEWFTPTGDHGTDFPGQTFTYDNTQQAATLWYHDHAMGVTRLNVYAGLAGFYIIHDENENNLIASNVLPNEKYDIPLAIQDRMFTTDYQLFYPADVLPPEGPVDTLPTPPSVHPEFFGDTILVNGKAWPVLDVEPRLYRFRILDGSNSRFYNLFLSSGQQIMQIGTEDGLLNKPVALDHLTIAPGERADVVIDFSKLAGQTIILRNNAKGPFPSGTPADPRTVGQIMAFRVGPSKSLIPDATLTTDTTLNTATPATVLTDPVAHTRELGLFEATDMYGRLIQQLGTLDGPNPGPKAFRDPITEVINQGDTEIWHIYNTTEDTHPIHLHQVNFQIISRQKFKADQDSTGALSNIRLIGQPKPPDANEEGWKDTVRMNPGEVTTVKAKFDLPGKYVWHCHILEHEEHDMMRFFFVKPNPPTVAAALPSTLTTSAVATTSSASSSVTLGSRSTQNRTIQPTTPTSLVQVLTPTRTVLRPNQKLETSLLDELNGMSSS
jgi:spore coat protein A, manganese oxidase